MIDTREIVKKTKSSKKKFDVNKIRKDFPILSRKVRGNKQLVYLDNAATSQKPRAVIKSMIHYYSEINSNVHRGVHLLSEEATKEYEEARTTIQKHINAKSSREIIFLRGATEAINLVASSYGKSNLKEGDEIIISAMEHHSNIVPWQILCQQTGAKLRIIPINDEGELILDEFEKLINPKTKFVSIVHISNSLGTINPIKEIIKITHSYNIPVLVDGPQAIPHMEVNVQELDCDFYTISGHKAFGPTGIGVLYGKEEFLETMPPYQGGGDMIKSVSFEKTIYNDLPFKFEAGTPNIEGAIGFKAAIDYINKIGLKNISEYEHELLEYSYNVLSDISGLKFIGTAKEKASVVSFTMENIHPHDIGTILDQEGVAIRTGHHCTQPIMERFGIPATSRASFAFYNTKNEIDILKNALQKVIKLLS